jgi:hypothetical protein
MVVHAVTCEPVSRCESLLKGNYQGILQNSAPRAPNPRQISLHVFNGLAANSLHPP